MKFRISLFLLTLALAASLTSTAHASACSNSTIRGTYAITIRGTIFLPDGSTLLIDGIAKTTFDGNGNLTQVDAVATNGNLAPGWRPGTGTYSVSPNCTGTQTTVIPGMRSVHNAETNCLVSDKGPLPPSVLDILKGHRWERNFYDS